MADYDGRTVDVGRPLADKQITSVAICAGAGGTLLSGIDADVYFTGEMQHVGLSFSSSACFLIHFSTKFLPLSQGVDTSSYVS